MLHFCGESYVPLPNGIRYTRSWMRKVIGDETTKAMVGFCESLNNMKLTRTEVAILIPLLMTNYGISIDFSLKLCF